MVSHRVVVLLMAKSFGVDCCGVNDDDGDFGWTHRCQCTVCVIIFLRCNILWPTLSCTTHHSIQQSAFSSDIYSLDNPQKPRDFSASRTNFKLLTIQFSTFSQIAEITSYLCTYVVWPNHQAQLQPTNQETQPHVLDNGIYSSIFLFPRNQLKIRKKTYLVFSHKYHCCPLILITRALTHFLSRLQSQSHTLILTSYFLFLLFACLVSLQLAFME